MNPAAACRACAACALVAAMPSTARAWWPALDEAVARAREHAPQVVQARGQVDVARSAGVRASTWAIGNPYVQVFVDRTAIRARGFGEPDPATYVQPEVYLPIGPPGQRGARIEEASRLLGWKQVEASDASSRAAGEAVTAYGQAVLARLRLDEARAAEELAREEADIAAQRAGLGDATVLDAQVQKLEAARHAQARAEARLRFLDARARLAILLGEHALSEPSGAALGLPPMRRAWTRAEVVRRAEQAPLVKALDAEENYWRAAHTRALADRLPPITLIAWGARGDMGELRMGGGVGFSLPLFDRNQGEVARVLAERSRTVGTRAAAVHALQERAWADVEVLRAVREAVEQADREGLPAAAAVVDAARRAAEAGKGERVRVVMARRDLVQARERRLQLVEEGWRACGELASILGELP